MHRAETRRAVRRHLLPVALLVFAAVGLVAAPAGLAAGPPTAGKTWRSGSTLKVFSKLPKRYDRSIGHAIGELNRSGARIRLKRVSRPKGVQVVLKLASIRESGLSTQGRPRSGRSTVLIAKRFDRAARGDGPHFAAFLIAHELGHVLGLDHPLNRPRMCSVMNPAFFGVCRRPRQKASEWLCGVVRPIDRKALARLYGGRARGGARWYCKLPGPKPLAMKVEGATVEVVPGDYALAARVRWTPVKGLRMLIERRDAACANVKPGMPIKTMENSGADNTVNAGVGVAVDPFATEKPLTVCYSLTLIDRKTGGRSKTVRVEARLQSADGTG